MPGAFLDSQGAPVPTLSFLAPMKAIAAKARQIPLVSSFEKSEHPVAVKTTG